MLTELFNSRVIRPVHQTHVSLFTTTKYNSTQNSVSRLIYNIKLSVSITIFTLIILTKSREILLSKERVIFTSKMLQPSRCNCPAGAGIKVCPTLYISLLSSLVKAKSSLKSELYHCDKKRHVMIQDQLDSLLRKCLFLLFV